MTHPAGNLRLVPSSGAPSDGEVIERVRLGDRGAAKTLYERYARMVNGLVFRLLGDVRDLDDLAQEVFLRAFARLPTLKDPDAFAGWLRAIAVHTVQDHLIKQRRRPWNGLRRTRLEPEELVASSAPPDVAAEIREVYGILGRLGVQERLVLVLQRIEEYSTPQIAEITGLSESTVRRRLASADARIAKTRGRHG